MDTVNHLVTGFLKVNHSHGKAISGGALYSGLKDTAANQGIPSPLPGVGVLAVDSDAELFSRFGRRERQPRFLCFFRVVVYFLRFGIRRAADCVDLTDNHALVEAGEWDIV
jgi:hypothetical protein